MPKEYFKLCLNCWSRFNKYCTPRKATRMTAEASNCLEEIPCWQRGRKLEPQPWISVNDKLPKEDKNVLVAYNPCHFPDGHPGCFTLALAKFTKNQHGEWFWWREDGYGISQDEVTYWMHIQPLP